MAGSTAQLLIQVRADAGQATAMLNELTMQTRQLEQIMSNTMPAAVKKAADETEKATSTFGKFKDQFADIGKFAIGAALGNLGATLGMGLAERLKQAAESIDTFGLAVARVQRLTGESAENSSELLGLLTKYGMSSDQASTALVKLDRSLAGLEDPLEVVQAGGKSGAQQLTTLGISATDASGHLRSTLDVIEDLAARMQSMSSAEQIGVISSVFKVRGNEAADLQRVLGQGREAIEAYFQLLRDTGNTVSQEQVNDVLAFADAHRQLDLALRGVSIQLGATFMPAVTSAAVSVTDFSKQLNSVTIPALHQMQDFHLDGLGPTTAGLLGLAATAKVVATVVASPFVGAFAMAAAAVYTFSQPLRDSIDTLYQLKEVYDALPQEQLNAPVVGGAARAMRDLLDKLPDRTSASAAKGPEIASAAEATAEPPEITAAKQAADNIKGNLQAIEDAAAQRKADFDVAHVGAEQQALSLKMQQADIDQQMLAYKQQLQDIDRQAIDYAQQRRDLDEQDAITRAKIAGQPLENQNSDIAYQENLIKAKVAAARAGGAPVDMDTARRQIADLEKQKTLLQPSLLTAQHDVTLADRTQQSDSMQNSLRNDAVSRAKLDVQESMQPLQDEATARQRAAESTQKLLDLDKQRFDLSEMAYKAQELLAQATQKAAEHTLFVLQHPVSAAYGPPSPVGQATQSAFGPTTEVPGSNDQRNQIQVNVDITHNATDEGSLLDKVWQQFVAAWDQAMQHAPVNGQLGGSYTGIAGR